MTIRQVAELSQQHLIDSAKSVVSVGYKKTDVGIIPMNWKSISLGEIAEVKMCKRVLSAQTSKTGPIPFFKIGTFGGESDAFISQSLYDEFKAKYSFPEKGDVLISAAGTLGKTVVYDGKPSYFQDSNIVWLKVDKTKILNEYLYHYYRVIKWASSEGSTISRLYNGIIRSSLVSLPPLKEQAAIANALFDVDLLIDELEKLITKKQAIKTATMQQLLIGRTRLPQFALHADGSKKGYKQSELGEIPEDWEVKLIKDVIDKERGIRYGIVQPGNYDPKGRLMVRGQDYSKGWVAENEIFRVSDAVELRYKNARLKAGDLIITIVGAGTGHVEIVPAWLDGANLTQTTARMTIDERVANARFIQAALLTKEGQTRIGSFIKGNAQPGLNCTDIYEFQLVCPKSISEQNTIATILSAIDDEIEVLGQRLVKTCQIKKGMMQELLTGKTRLPFELNDQQGQGI